MSYRIVRNDITKMTTEAIVNTANEEPAVGDGCDRAIYLAAGSDELLAYRKEHIGRVPEGEVFITPGFGLVAKYIIHAVSPFYEEGREGVEEKLRSCYRKSLALAKEKGIRSISFPLISTGSFGYPKEEGMRIAIDEINAFLLGNDMEICLVVFGDETSSLGRKLYPGLEEYIDTKYVSEKVKEEYFGGEPHADAAALSCAMAMPSQAPRRPRGVAGALNSLFQKNGRETGAARRNERPEANVCYSAPLPQKKESIAEEAAEEVFVDFETEHESKLQERMKHLSDTFSQYLLYLIKDKHMENAEVYKRAIVDKKIFSKIKNNPDYHPQKLTALCLCVGARLNLDETKDLLARAGYALSPCDKTDIIFSYFIENEIYDMIELDIQLEEHGLPCIIS